MDESIHSLIQRACELARSLESNLPNLQPDMVVRRIDEIVETLNAAKERPLMRHHEEALKQESIQQPQMGLTSSMLQELLSRSGTSSYAQSVSKLIQMQQLQSARSTTPSRGALQIGEMGGRDVEGSAEGEVEASPCRRRRRKDDPEKRTLMVPAVQFGNTEMPPEDGFTWRKYGQKEILGSNYPRSYYRCTHQKLYECPAKKQVQRLDNNPNIFAVTYRGNHTCHMSSTAPSSSVPPQLLPLDISQSHDIAHGSTTSSQLSPSSASVSGWLSSVHLSLLAGNSGSGGGMAPTAADGGGAGPSTSRFGADYLVADMADAMFNSGSSSGNSMESLFPPAEDKWKSGDKKS